MRSALPVLAALLVAAGAVAWMFASGRSRVEAAEARLEREELKRQFLERAAASRQLEQDRAQEWRDEARALLRWYFEELATLGTRHPGRSPGAPEKPRPGKEADEARAEWRRYAEERFALLRDGKYEPVLSGGENGLRLDLLALEPGKNPATGERGLRFEFALWGAPRRVERETMPGMSKTVTRVSVPVSFQAMSVRLLDAKGTLYAEMQGSGEPYQKLHDPERFVEDFPPGIVFGTWWLDLFPREAATAELVLALASRGQAGAEIRASYRFDLPVREDWKLAAGQAFEAQTREAPQ